jgi:hypothetical protein
VLELLLKCGAGHRGRLPLERSPSTQLTNLGCRWDRVNRDQTYKSRFLDGQPAGGDEHHCSELGLFDNML